MHALFLASGDQWGIANALMGLGCMAYEQGDDATAAYFEQALTLRRAMTDQWSSAATLIALRSGAATARGAAADPRHW